MKFHGTFPISNSLHVVFTNYTHPRNSNIFITKLHNQMFLISLSRKILRPHILLHLENIITALINHLVDWGRRWLYWAPLRNLGYSMLLYLDNWYSTFRLNRNIISFRKLPWTSPSIDWNRILYYPFYHVFHNYIYETFKNICLSH